MAKNPRHKSVLEIVVPCRKGVPLYPSVKPTDRIIDAVELMVNHNLRQVAVASNDRIVGMVRLEDAFANLGLSVSFETA